MDENQKSFINDYAQLCEKYGCMVECFHGWYRVSTLVESMFKEQKEDMITEAYDNLAYRYFGVAHDKKIEGRNP